MNGNQYSEEYAALLEGGPFPGQIDPWVEIGRYFHLMHNNLIGYLQAQLQKPLLMIGYIVGRETSLQIAEGRQPDLYIERRSQRSQAFPHWDYVLAAEEALAQPGIAIGEEHDLDALHIRDLDKGDLVTVVEIVSPTNKDKELAITEYRARRERLVTDQGVHVVEIDLTRSVKRWTDDPITAEYAYHVALHFPDRLPRIVGIKYAETLPRIAIPLRTQVIATNLQPVYDHAYQVGAIAGHIDKEGRYTEADLPFPSLLTDYQRRAALSTISQWQSELSRLLKA